MARQGSRTRDHDRAGHDAIPALRERLRPGRARRPGHHGDPQRDLSAARPHAVAGPGTSRETSGALTLAAAAEPRPMLQPTGPSGLQPKNWLMPGVWTTAIRPAVEPRAAAATQALRQPTPSACPRPAP